MIIIKRLPEGSLLGAPKPLQREMARAAKESFHYWTAQVFTQAWNLTIGKQLQYESRLKRIAETHDNELTRYHAAVMLRLMDEVGKLDGFGYLLSLQVFDHMGLQLDGKLTVVLHGGIRMTIWDYIYGQIWQS